jgi:hypothetical protein
VTDIKIGLTIKDEVNAQHPSQFGLAIAGEQGDPIQVHIEAYGFQANRQGALDIASFLRDMVRALEGELGLRLGSDIGTDELSGHNTLDRQCKFTEVKLGETFNSAARCPQCRPVRPSFNPQPVGKQ